MNHSEKKILSTNDGKLQISSSSFNDTGKYICKASNVLGQDQKKNKTFRRRWAVVILIIPQSTLKPLRTIDIKI